MGRGRANYQQTTPTCWPADLEKVSEPTPPNDAEETNKEPVEDSTPEDEDVSTEAPTEDPAEEPVDGEKENPTQN